MGGQSGQPALHTLCAKNQNHCEVFIWLLSVSPSIHQHHQLDNVDFLSFIFYEVK